MTVTTLCGQYTRLSLRPRGSPELRFSLPRRALPLQHPPHPHPQRLRFIMLNCVWLFLLPCLHPFPLSSYGTSTRSYTCLLLNKCMLVDWVVTSFAATRARNVGGPWLGLSHPLPSLRPSWPRWCPPRHPHPSPSSPRAAASALAALLHAITGMLANTGKSLKQFSCGGKRLLLHESLGKEISVWGKKY